MDAPTPLVLLLPATDAAHVADEEVILPDGWRPHLGFDLPEQPWDLRSARVACIGTVGDEASARAAMAALARGAGLAVRVAIGGSGRHRFLEDLHKVSQPVPYEPAPSSGVDGLAPLQHELLGALSRGATVTAAAAELHVSRRTANRLLADARARLDADSNAAAVRRWISSYGPTGEQR